jgi:hypothetical protein
MYVLQKLTFIDGQMHRLGALQRQNCQFADASLANAIRHFYSPKTPISVADRRSQIPRIDA